MLGERIVAELLALPDHQLAPLAERLMPHDEWMGTDAAAAYLGITPAALRTRVGRTGPHPIPVHQERAGGRLAFKRSELDAWQRGD